VNAVPDPLTVRGGITGITAVLDDVEHQAALMERVGQGVGDLAARLAHLSASPDLLEAGVLCPVEVAQAEMALTQANIGADGVAAVWLSAEASAVYLRAVVATYRGIDQVLVRDGGDFVYTSIVRGLLTAAGSVGYARDIGALRAVPTGGVSTVDLAATGFVADVMKQQEAVSQHAATIQIVTVRGEQGPAYIVQIPGTQEWSPQRGDNPFDLTSDLTLQAGRRAVLEDGVVAAMEAARIPADAPVMLTGHSLGGIVAASIAADAAYRKRFTITSVVTAGSPIAHVTMPADVAVLSLEEKQDLVPRLDGAANPDQPNWVTVTRDVAQGPVTGDEVDPVDAHSLANYEQTAHLVDDNDAPALEAWRAQTRAFVGPGSAQQYRLETAP